MKSRLCACKRPCEEYFDGKPMPISDELTNETIDDENNNNNNMSDKETVSRPCLSWDINTSDPRTCSYPSCTVALPTEECTAEGCTNMMHHLCMINYDQARYGGMFEEKHGLKKRCLQCLKSEMSKSGSLVSMV